MKTLTITLLRHGKTLENKRGVYLGRTNAPLSEEGVTALKSLSPPPADLVFSSPLLRCIQSAELLYPDFEPVVLDALQERDFGEFEGKTHAQITTLPGFSRWGMETKSMRFPQGEPYFDFLSRTRRGFWQAIRYARRERARHIVLLTHGGVIMSILLQLAHPYRSFYNWQCANAGGYRCILQKNRLFVQEEIRL